MAATSASALGTADATDLTGSAETAGRFRIYPGSPPMLLRP